MSGSLREGLASQGLSSQYQHVSILASRTHTILNVNVSIKRLWRESDRHGVLNLTANNKLVEPDDSNGDSCL